MFMKVNFKTINRKNGLQLLRSRSDILYDPKGHGNLFGWFDLVYFDLKNSKGPSRGSTQVLCLFPGVLWL